MRDFIDLGGTTPPMETCAQVGSREYDYLSRARFEARLYMDQLRRLLGPEPDGAGLGIKSHPHDFGTYLTVVCRYDPDNQTAAEYARRCEENGPVAWDAPAQALVAQLGKEESHG